MDSHRPRHLSSFRDLFLVVALVVSLGVVSILIRRSAGRSATPVRAVSGLSSSKLGVFLLNSSAGGTQILNAAPKVINVFDPQKTPALVSMVRAYKTAHPDGQVIMRVYDGTQSLHYTTADNPDTAALDYWNRAIQPAINNLNAADRALFTYQSGPVEYNATPAITNATDAAWVGAFWSRLADVMNQSGFRPNLGEIPVGNPDVSNLSTIMPPLIPALRKIKSYGGVWSYHAYTLAYATDVAGESWYSLRYRKIYEYLAVNYPDLATMPMILTEAGVDKTGDPTTSGWQARGDAVKYEQWLQWFDTQIKQDSYILGATIFQIGDNYWSSFNIESIASWLAGYLGASASPTPTGIVATPTVTPRPSPTVTPSPTIVLPTVIISGACRRSAGDANCDGTIDITDFEIFRKEFTGAAHSLHADFDGDSKVTLIDFEIWRQSKFKGILQ